MLIPRNCPKLIKGIKPGINRIVQQAVIPDPKFFAMQVANAVIPDAVSQKPRRESG
jgi:hypothetical protein